MNPTRHLMRWLRSFFYSPPGKTVKPKNPRRVEGGKKAARTKARRKAEARMVELYGDAALHPDAQVKP